MNITLIAAMSENLVIGDGKQLPWKLKDDLKHFKETTQGYPIIIGRKTFESFGNKPLPYRENIVLSNNPSKIPSYLNVSAFDNINDALHMAKKISHDKVFVCGGATVYEDFLDIADLIYLTRVECQANGFVKFPTDPLHDDEWEPIKLIDSFTDDERNEHPFHIELYNKKSIYRTLKGWEASNVDLDFYLNPMDEIDDELFDTIASPSSFNDGTFFQNDEPEFEEEGLYHHQTIYVNKTLNKNYYLGILPAFEQ